MEEPEYDRITQASLNGIYVKAQEMDRGHNDAPAPSFLPPGARERAQVHASTHASTHASDSEVPASCGGDRSTIAGTHGSDGETRASDAETHASDGGALAFDAETHVSDGDEPNRTAANPPGGC